MYKFSHDLLFLRRKNTHTTIIYIFNFFIHKTFISHSLLYIFLLHLSYMAEFSRHSPSNDGLKL